MLSRMDLWKRGVSPSWPGSRHWWLDGWVEIENYAVPHRCALSLLLRKIDSFNFVFHKKQQNCKIDSFSFVFHKNSKPLIELATTKNSKTEKMGQHIENHDKKSRKPKTNNNNWRMSKKLKAHPWNFREVPLFFTVTFIFCKNQRKIAIVATVKFEGLA